MKTLFRSLPDDLMTPAFREQCQEIAGSINAFLVTSGLGTERFPDLASFMKKPDLVDAYINQAVELGWPTMDIDGFIRDGHMAAIEAFIQDGGKLKDFSRICDFNLMSAIEVLAEGGVRGLFHHTGMIHCPHTVKLTHELAKTLYGQFSKKDIAIFIDQQMGGDTHANMVAIGAQLGGRPYKAWFNPSQIKALSIIDAQVFEVEDEQALNVMIARGLDARSTERLTATLKLQDELKELIRRGVVVDKDEKGIAERMHAMTLNLVCFMEIPAQQALMRGGEAASVWRDLSSRMSICLQYVVNSTSKNFLAGIMTHSIIRETERFWGLKFPDEQFLEARREQAARLWKTLEPDDRVACTAVLSMLEYWRSTPVSRFESSASGFHALARAINTPDSAPKTTDFLKRWPQGVNRYLWPMLVEKNPLIGRQSPVNLQAALVMATVWAQQAQVRSKESGNMRALYGEKLTNLQKCTHRARLLGEDRQVKILAMRMLKKESLLTADAIHFMKWGGSGLEELDMDISETAQAALLEHDLGL
jgi:hypothetical protein